MGAASVTDVRTGQHLCFDRMVLNLNGPVAGYTAQYVPRVVQDGSGFTIPLQGRAFLQVTVNAPSYNSETGTVTYSPAAKAELSNMTGTRPSGRWPTQVALKAIQASASASVHGYRSGCSPWTDRLRVAAGNQRSALLVTSVSC